MTDYRRRIVIDMPFDAALVEMTQAIRDEGLETIARVDVRDHVRRSLGHDFRRYFLIEAWSPALAFAAFQRTLDIGTALPAAFVVYELADGETAVVAQEPLASLDADGAWRRDAPALAAIADEESAKVARVLDRLQHRSLRRASTMPAA
jgi:uncharacterized protein (DUF302 family)